MSRRNSKVHYIIEHGDCAHRATGTTRGIWTAHMVIAVVDLNGHTVKTGRGHGQGAAPHVAMRNAVNSALADAGHH